MLNAQSDLTDIELQGEEIQFKSDGKEDTAELKDQLTMHPPNDTYQNRFFLPTLPFLTSYGNEPIKKFVAELNGRKLPHRAIPVYNF